MRPRRPQDDEPSLTKIFVVLLVMVAVVYPAIDDSRRRTRVAHDAPDLPTPKAEVPEEVRGPLERARALLRTDPDAALVAIEDALEHAGEASAGLRAELHDWAAAVHLRRWHLVRARAEARAALDEVPTKARQRKLTRIERAFAESESERGTAAVYVASRDAGPARTLRGRVVVAYVMVDPPGPTRWTSLEELRVRDVLAGVESWYADRADEHGAPAPEFVERWFKVPLAGGDLPAFGDLAGVGRTARELALNLGHPTLGSLLRSLMEQELADQAMLVVHAPIGRRSFALRCVVECDHEVALVYDRIERREFERLGYALAHEGMHLFGADDLYPVAGAEEFEPEDIMQHESSRLAYSDVGELTAWAIGWRHDRPTTPFPVED